MKELLVFTNLKKMINLNYSLRLLLPLEWILVGISIIMELQSKNFPKPIFAHESSTINPILLFVSIFIFGSMGFWLPRCNQLSKLLYTAVELLLILAASISAGHGIGFSPPLLLILVIRSFLIFKLIGRLLVVGLVWLCFIGSLNLMNYPPQIQQKMEKFPEEQIRNFVWSLKLNMAILFTLVLIFVSLLVNTLLAELQSRQKLALAHEQLRQYALRVEDQATLQERNRIAREIHDALGHLLTAQSIQLENALLFLESNFEKSKGFLLEAKNLGTNALKEVRYSVATLRSDPLQGKSLDSAIALLLAEFQARTQISPDYSLRLEPSVSPELSRTIYRIVQEALTNISKHSAATKVTIDIQATTDSLCLRVEDNGIGFNPNQNTTGFGLKGMRERTSALGGQLYITSEPNDGCQIMAFFPLSRLS
ncbi:sensor histidine kinase [Iningainema tapete]|uniref:Sensor histidine kinase n=1 Tax=Iningainema tapete BLCC-T55 TaxID=2748662 RepID=A0A8J7C0G3_9CYAN|nr:sensor histidine kinase [Iningainema tapete]MBD2777978.1 sensor histidine kinase [Iningainema tapete BLCC-T55]